jgi:uncharacterized membrane protein
MTKNLWQSFIVRVFLGTLEEYYAAREIHLREQRKYRRTAQHIIGAVLVLAPLFLLLLLGYLPLVPWALFVFLITLGHILVSDAATEHLCLLLLRRERDATPKSE